jgi:hypothetical protein
MKAKVWFDEQDVEHEALAVGTTPKHMVVQKDVLFFHFRGGAENALQLDTPATEKHKQDYKQEFKAFVDSKAEMQKALETPESVKTLEVEHD